MRRRARSPKSAAPAPTPPSAASTERFSHKLAIAPTASICVICGGTSACIEPIPANIYTHKTLSGSFSVRNPALQKVLAAKGPEHRGHLAVDPRARRLGAASRGLERRREGRVPHGVRDRPALGRRARRRSRAAHLPGPVAEPLSAQRHPQVGSADAALDGVGARREESLYYCRSKSVQRAGFAGVEADNTRAWPQEARSKPTTTNTTSASSCQ